MLTKIAADGTYSATVILLNYIIIFGLTVRYCRYFGKQSDVSGNMNHNIHLMRILLFPLFALLFFSLHSCGYSDSADFLIPENYRGRIAVVFNQTKGQKPMFLNGRRIYEIPQNGILLTQFVYKPGFVDYRYFLVDDKGNRVLLPNYEYDYNKDGTVHYLLEDSNKVGIFGHGTSVAYASEGNSPGLEVFVSTFNGLDTVETMQHFNQRVDTLLGLYY